VRRYGDPDECDDPLKGSDETGTPPPFFFPLLTHFFFLAYTLLDGGARARPFPWGVTPLHRRKTFSWSYEFPEQRPELFFPSKKLAIERIPCRVGFFFLNRQPVHSGRCTHPFRTNEAIEGELYLDGRAFSLGIRVRVFPPSNISLRTRFLTFFSDERLMHLFFPIRARIKTSFFNARFLVRRSSASFSSPP